MASKYFNKQITNKNVQVELDQKFIEDINSLSSKISDKMDTFHIADAIDVIMNLLRESNKYIDETMPWALAKDSSKSERLETVLYNLLESIRVCAIELYPFLPDTSDKILEQLNTNTIETTFKNDTNYNLNDPEILFSRIDKDKFMENI